jgi:hypothetical protein
MSNLQEQAKQLIAEKTPCKFSDFLKWMGKTGNETIEYTFLDVLSFIEEYNQTFNDDIARLFGVELSEIPF